ncbi:thiol reductase thioredoxin [Sporosarcina sp. NCCP-2716]|uniref:thioredoxin family protein n=1 Tax=Sporosarcina sp. NCCP-2716 TaxID=2943679 RepID=UPI00203C2C39|nr:thioredoxin family protein [Sporosarcina sp. NCCP-2716]GKV68243.1 thiol reductase thioredoxin [Sporosarcina sp. NCCP-2716]
MNDITSFADWQQQAAEQEALLLFVKADHCSVCDGLYPQVAELEDRYSFPFAAANVSAVPEMAGQLSLFSAPVVLLFSKGREFARFARFVPMESLKKRLDELEGMVCG